MNPQVVHDQHPAAVSGNGNAWLWLVFLGLLAGYYLLGTLSPRHKQPWPWHRTLLWTGGLLAAGAGLIGPIAGRGGDDFRHHMLAHLLLGMLSPLLLVLAAPLTLLLRVLPPSAARRVAHLLGSPPLRSIAHPVTALALNTGGLWLLYTTGLFHRMHGSGVWPAMIAVHMLAAGYLFTAAIIGIDPIRRRPSWMIRAAVLIAAMAGHAMLAKWLYAHPPAGVPVDQAEAGAQLMYYGGDAVDLLLVIIFCAQWYRRTRPRTRPSAAPALANRDHPSVASSPACR